jgi:type II secretory pathway pseudopilin PulG
MTERAPSGFILIYTILAIGVFAVLVTEVMYGTLREIDTSDNEIGATVANGAADAGLECVNYWQKQGYPFNSSTPGVTIRCESSAGAATLTTLDDTDAVCEDHTYPTITMPFPGGACAQITIQTVAAGGAYCEINATVIGMDNCASPTTYRTRLVQL